MNSDHQPTSKNVVWERGRVARAKRIAAVGQQGATVWLTGLPASGKSTLAKALEETLIDAGVSAYRLDGDNLRHGMCGDLGFSDDDREENVRRTSHLARILADAGVVAIVALVSPFKASRAAARTLHERDGLRFVEVFVDTPLEECERRDPKGLYAKARAGELEGMTGIDSAYEPAEGADLRFAPPWTPTEAVARIAELLQQWPADEKPLAGLLMTQDAHNRSVRTPELLMQDTAEAAEERDHVAAGLLPPRYGSPWKQPFLDRVSATLRPGIRILDVGSGARPVVPPECRPLGCHYAGLDVSAAELDRAGPGAYDERIVADIGRPCVQIENRFDLVLSWQVLEHVASMRAALDTQHRALTSRGRMIAMVSGSFAVHALLARIIPYRVSTALQERLLGIDGADKFPTRFNCCRASRLGTLLEQGGWRSHEIVPLYKGGGYFAFSPTLLRLYLRYENAICRANRHELATHYIIDALQ